MAAIAETRDLMLPAQLALAFQPVIKQVLACNDNFKLLHGLVLKPLSLIVGIDMLQRIVKLFRKLLHRSRFFGKFNYPLMTALRVLVHKHRSYAIFKHLCTGFGTYRLQGFLGIVNYKFLAEHIYKMLCTARYDELVRVLARKTYRIANHITPQTAGCRYQHGIVLAHFHLRKATYLGVLFLELVHRDKLEEDTIVYHQHHGGVGQVVLCTEIALACIVGFYIMHLAATDNLVVLFAIGGKSYASVEEYFQNSLALCDKKVRNDLFHYNHPVYTKVRDRVPSYYGEDCEIENCIVADGCMLEGEAEDSILFRQVTIGEGASVENSLIMNDTVVGEGAQLECVILDKDVVVRPGAKLIGSPNAPIIIRRGEIV